jgi:hypothetical protein
MSPSLAQVPLVHNDRCRGRRDQGAWGSAQEGSAGAARRCARVRPTTFGRAAAPERDAADQPFSLLGGVLGDPYG